MNFKTNRSTDGSLPKATHLGGLNAIQEKIGDSIQTTKMSCCRLGFMCSVQAIATLKSLNMLLRGRFVSVMRLFCVRQSHQKRYS